MKLLLGLGLLMLTTQCSALYTPASFIIGKETVASASAIVTKLSTEMNFSADQKARITEILNAFIEEKVKILPLLETDRTAYAEKQTSYFKMLKSKLSEVMMRSQMERFLQLKPKSTETDSALYYIFY